MPRVFRLDSGQNQHKRDPQTKRQQTLEMHFSFPLINKDKILMKQTLALIALSSVFASSAFAANKDPMKPFPTAEAGMVRKVINLPAVKNPDLYRVQLLPGKMMEVDCNRTRLSGTMTEKTAEGWGFNYWVVSQVGAGASTMMACDPKMKKTQEFVSIYSEQLHRYNAKLPLVVYVPEGIELRYRIFSAKEKTSSAVNE